MPSADRDATLRFHVRSRFTTVRDLAMVGFLALVCGGFLASAWSGPAAGAAASPSAPAVVAGR